MKVVLHGGGRGTFAYAKIAKEMKKQGIDARLLISDKISYEALKKEKDIDITYLHENLNPFQHSGCSEERLEYLERKYGTPNLYRIIKFVGTAARYLPYSKKISFLCAYFNFFEKYFDEVKPDAYVTCVDVVEGWSSFRVAKAKKRFPFVIKAFRIPGRVKLTDDFSNIPYLSDEYEMLKRKKLSLKEQEIVKKVRSMYLEKLKPTWYSFRKFPKKVPSIKKFLDLIRAYYKGDEAYFSEPLFITLLNHSFNLRIKSIINSSEYNRLANRELITSNKKYFFYPLHLEPEIALSVMGKLWIDQVEVIRVTAENLPANTFLFVKEHPSMLFGYRPIGFYKKIASFPNVVLVPPDISSYELINNSLGVVTVNGTAGWECLFFEKPTITFGEAFYNNFYDGVFRVENINTIYYILKNAPQVKFSEKFDRFIVAVWNRTYEGEVNWDLQLAYSDENIKNLTEAIIKEVQLWKKRKKQ